MQSVTELASKTYVDDKISEINVTQIESDINDLKQSVTQIEPISEQVSTNTEEIATNAESITTLQGAVAGKQDRLEAGEGIEIDEDNKISVTSAKKVYTKFVVVGVYGQSNAVGYDENPLVEEDKNIDTARLLQYSKELKPLTFCADNTQNMNWCTGNDQPGMETQRRANDAFEVMGEDKDGVIKNLRYKYVMTKGIHLPLAKLIAKNIPDDYGVIIVPGAVGGYGIDKFMKGATNAKSAIAYDSDKIPYEEFLSRLQAAMDTNKSDNIFGGIIWCQGESDKGSMDADIWMSKFLTIVNDLNTDLAPYVEPYRGIALSLNDWYFYEFPNFYRDGHATNYFAKLQTTLGSRYVSIPADTLTNTTTYTSGTKAAHYAQDTFRTVIAPAVFDAMKANGAFEKVDVLPKETLIATLNQLLAFHDQGKICAWRSAKASDWGDKGWGYSDDYNPTAAIPNTYKCNNANGGYVLSSDIKGVKFKIKSPTKPKDGFVTYFICSDAVESDNHYRGVVMGFQTSTQTVYKQWVKVSQSYNANDGTTNNATVAQIKGVFNELDTEICAELISNGNIRVTGSGYSYELTPNDAMKVRFGFGELGGGWSQDVEIYDIKVLAPIS